MCLQPQEKEEQTLKQKKDEIALEIADMQKSLDEKIERLTRSGNKLERNEKSKVSELINELKDKKRDLKSTANRLQHVTEDNIDALQKESSQTFDRLKEDIVVYADKVQEWVEAYEK